MQACPPAILVVEDNPKDEILIHSVLGRTPLPCRIVSARHRDDAIAYLAGVEPYTDRCRFPFPSMVLLDLALASQSGLGVLDWMKKHAAAASVPVVALTSEVVEGNLNRAYALGITAYLDKARGLKDLPAIVWGILGSG